MCMVALAQMRLADPTGIPAQGRKLSLLAIALFTEWATELELRQESSLTGAASFGPLSLFCHAFEN